MSSKPIITNDDVQQNEFYKRAVSTHNSEHFIFEAGETYIEIENGACIEKRRFLNIKRYLNLAE